MRRHTSAVRASNRRGFFPETSNMARDSGGIEDLWFACIVEVPWGIPSKLDKLYFMNGASCPEPPFVGALQQDVWHVAPTNQEVAWYDYGSPVVRGRDVFVNGLGFQPDANSWRLPTAAFGYWWTVVQGLQAVQPKKKKLGINLCQHSRVSSFCNWHRPQFGKRNFPTAWRLSPLTADRFAMQSPRVRMVDRMMVPTQAVRTV